MADVSLRRGGRAHDHMVQQRFGCPRSSWSLASAQDETQLLVLASPGGSSRLGPHACTSNTALVYDFDPPHLPHCPAEVAKESPWPLLCLHLPQRSGSALRHLFHRPHLHVSDLQDTGGHQPTLHVYSGSAERQKATCT